jgi:hypothetical protein
MYRNWAKPNPDLLGSKASTAAALRAKVAAGHALFNENAAAAKTALLDAGYTEAQIASQGTSSAQILRTAVANTNFVPATKPGMFKGVKNPMVIYAAIAAGAAGLFFFAKKRKSSRKKASR